MIHARRIGVTAVAVLAALAASPGLAQAQQPPGATTEASGGGLPPGWQVTGAGAGRQLVWRSERTVPMGDARVEFHADGRLLGVPEESSDGRTFRLALDRATSLEDLQVLAGGRRLDAAAGNSGDRDRSPLTAARPPAAPAANSVDPGKPGSYRTVSGEYRLDSVKLPGYPEKIEMQAVVVAPKGATGKRPLALFLHGRHYTCYKPGSTDEATGNWPCPAGLKPIPSYNGYLQDQKLLASQGYVTVSISANGINAQDGDVDDGGAQARSSLVRRHLAEWANWAAHPGTAPAAVRSAPKADLSKVLLVGHSRGGEGVNRAAMDSLYPAPADQDGYRGPVRWKIAGTVDIGPTIFGQNPVADVPSVSLLPGCDGDVADLEGETFVDGTRGVSKGAALHSAVYVVGANHNFFNTEWTPGKAVAPSSDDFWEDSDNPDPVCSVGAPTRLTADQQHKVGSTYIAAAARLFVAGDDRVRPLLDGSGTRAPSADPARVLTHAVGGRRTGGFLLDDGVKVTGGRVCWSDPDPAKACLDDATTLGMSPHFQWWDLERDTGKRAVAMKWSAPGTPTKFTYPGSVSLSGAKNLALRVFVPPNTTGTKLDVTVTDSAGRRAKLGQAKIDGLPGSARTSSYWARELRLPLTAATRAGLDLRHVKSLELTPRSGSGHAWFMDAWGWAPGLPAVKAAALPRVDIGRMTVKEGDSGTRTYHIPVKVSGHGSGKVRFYVVDPETGTAREKVVSVRPGATPIDVPVEVKGDKLYGYDKSDDLLVKAVRGAVVGAYRGGVTEQNDDPAPEATLTPVTDRVTEGGTLTWRISLSAPAEESMWFPVQIIPVTEGAELSTKDVDPQWLSEISGASPDPELPLSQLAVYTGPDVPAGSTGAEFGIPTVKDQVAEPEESVRLAVTDDWGNPLPDVPPVVGTVVDAP
ncbi:hypothetical protein [Streptomyces sp. NPDC002588]|uniref:hypothetical protein n=1 Tax=Streptomyces sp. NPDC002588 TaxID=3154419 RepID=UPI0033280C1E